LSRTAFRKRGVVSLLLLNSEQCGWRNELHNFFVIDALVSKNGGRHNSSGEANLASRMVIVTSKDPPVLDKLQEFFLLSVHFCSAFIYNERGAKMNADLNNDE
jgi:hypothetical protein